LGATKEQKISYVARKRAAAIALLGGKCNWPDCSWSDPRALQVDHINGGGHKELVEIGNLAIYNKILKIKEPEKEYQILCANHNWIKRHLNKEVGGRNTNAKDR